MHVRNRIGRLGVVCLAMLASGCAARAAGPTRAAPPGLDAEYRPLVQRLLAAEDARGTGPEGLAPLVEGAASSAARVRALAARGLGRMERDSLVPRIAPLLADAAPSVRAEAANALGQAVHRGDPGAARAALLARVAAETDAYVRGVIAQTLGRLRQQTTEQATTTARVLAGIDAAGDSAVVALAKGFFFLARQPTARGALPAEAAARLRSLARQSAVDDVRRARVRGLAIAALAAARAAEADDLERGLRDVDALVRREAAVALRALADTAAAARLAEGALRDPAGVVRLDALASYQRLTRSPCPGVRSALSDPEPHVALLAIDLAPASCPIDPGTRDRLIAFARALPAIGLGWHEAAHALVALATLQPDTARALLPRFTPHASPFVRTYAARAATRLRAEAPLRLLAGDPHPNVRTAAIEGLAATVGREADDLYIDALGSDDAQLVMAASAALAGSNHPRAGAALLAALDRFTRTGRETARDARVALIARLRELGGVEAVDALRARLADFDPVIADSAATVLAAWTGTRPMISPRALPRAPMPTPATLDSLAAVDVVVSMAFGGDIVLRLRPWLAPANAARFARLVRAGYFDGLTFHRVVPNFVVQGGSPHANEYAGDGPYTRDELGIDGNWRGTVGLSTRGRDTGDAQIYFNLVDNIRLDHDYTVFAEVVEGMEVVDRLLEGAVIERVTVR